MKAFDKNSENEVTQVLVAGLRVKTLLGETDTDENGAERITPAGSVGVLDHENLPGQWAVVFGDASVYIEAYELLDPAQYTFAA